MIRIYEAHIILLVLWGPIWFKKALQLRMQLKLLPKSLKAQVRTGAFDCTNVLHNALPLSYQASLGFAFSKKLLYFAHTEPHCFATSSLEG